jgi:hypothetical protein
MSFEAGYKAGQQAVLSQLKGHSNRWYDDKTFVIKTADIERLKLFLDGFGFTFIEEQHGDGPRHYSSSYEGLVLEIYPISNDTTQSNTD